MKKLIWTNTVIYDTDKNIIENAEAKICAREISCENCRGVAYYVSLKSVRGMDGEITAVHTANINDTDKYMAIEEHSPFWCRPFWGKKLSELPKKIQELVIEDNGIYRVFLSVCDSITKSFIRGSDNGVEFVVSTNKSGLYEIPEQLCFIVMEGNSATAVTKAAAKMAADLLGNGLKMREERKYPEVLEYLGWCSWDAFYIRVSHAGLVEKVKEFKSKHIPIHYAVIDDICVNVPHLHEIPDDISFRDMVKEQHKSKLYSFDADINRFPYGIKAAVDDIKKHGIPHVGIWFPTTGYWKGLDEKGVVAKELADCTELGTDGRIVVIPQSEQSDKYYDYFCSRCHEWGADIIKVDNQGFYNNFKDTYTFGESAAAIHNSLDKAAEKYFGGAIINCMGMPSECLFHRTESAVCRCSDDFKPESREWFAKNILQCSYNGLLQGRYHVNDWDIWWTDDEQAIKNSVCRAISGGPIYVSDKLGRTNAEVLKPLALKDGRILRPNDSATPTEDCIMQNPTTSKKIFKIRNRFGENGVLAVFNIDAENKQCTGTVSPADCELLGEKYAYFEYFSQCVGVIHRDERLNVTLDTNDDLKLYTFAPFVDGYAVIGRTDLYMGVGVVDRHENKVVFKETGKIAVIDENSEEIIMKKI